MAGLFGKIAIATVSLAAMLGLTGTTMPLRDFDRQVLQIHNRERSITGSPALIWDADLARGAQQWADFLAQTGRFEHSPNRPFGNPEGENLWMGTANAYSVQAMVGGWLAEKRHFIPGTFPENSRTGNVRDVAHYTQVIWSETTSIGCGLASSGKRDVLVCRYSTAGNIMGRNPI